MWPKDVDTSQIVAAINQLDWYLRDYNVSYRFCDDHEEFLDFANRLKDGVTPYFSDHFFDHIGSSFYCVMCETTSGVPVATHGAKLQDVGSGSLSELIIKSMRRLHVQEDGYRLGDNHHPILCDLSGKLVYFGDMFVAPEYRRSGIASTLTVISFVEALRRWSPDHVWALMRMEQASKGYATMAYWTHQHHGALDWDAPPSPLLFGDEVLCVQSRRDIRQLCRSYAQSWLRRQRASVQVATVIRPSGSSLGSEPAA